MIGLLAYAAVGVCCAVVAVRALLRDRFSPFTDDDTFELGALALAAAVLWPLLILGAVGWLLLRVVGEAIAGGKGRES